MNMIDLLLEAVGLDTLTHEAKKIPNARRLELQQAYATGGGSFDMGFFAGLALALRRIEAGAPITELRELVLAMAEQATFCRDAQKQATDPAFRAELDKEIALIDSGRATPNDASLALRDLETYLAEQERNGNGHAVAEQERSRMKVG